MIQTQLESIEQFIIVFDNRLNKYLDQREEDLRTPIERTINHFRISLQQWKQQQYSELRAASFNDIPYLQHVIHCLITNQHIVPDINRQQVSIVDQLLNQFHQLQKHDVQILHDIQKVIDCWQAKSDVNHILRQQFQKQMKQYATTICVNTLDDINYYNSELIQYQQHNKLYKILIRFKLNQSKLKHNLELINKIQQLNLNSKVGMIMFIFSADNYSDNYNDNLSIEWQDLIKAIIGRYDNIYYISIDDNSRQFVDLEVHGQLKQLVEQSRLLDLILKFKPGPNSTDTLEMIKQYNQIVKQKNSLEHVYYGHHRIQQYIFQKCKSQQGQVQSPTIDLQQMIEIADIL